MTETLPAHLRQRVRQLYAACNARDIDAVLEGLAADVAWANGMEGGYVHGRDGVRDYWTRQFREIRSTVEPERIELAPDRRVAVRVHQIVHSADGSHSSPIRPSATSSPSATASSAGSTSNDLRRRASKARSRPRPAGPERD
jgi:ketosteroid isomerase-like protein